MLKVFKKDIGIDLGTANTLVYLKGKGIIIREPSVVAVDTKTDAVRYVGQEAKNIIGRTPGSIRAVRPLKDGVIADFDMTTAMLQEFIRKAIGSNPFSKARVIICIPSGVTAVERRAVKEAAEGAGAKRVSIVEEPMAAAIGAGLPVEEPTGSMIVDIGGGTSEVAVISLCGIVTSRSVRVAGDEFDLSIINFIKRKYNLLIGERTAEYIKIEIGSAYPTDEDKELEIKGRNLLTGLPENITISSDEIREALSEPLSSFFRGNEQHFQGAVLDPHKSPGAAPIIFCDHQMRNSSERLRYIFFYLFDFTVRQKQVCCSYRTFPYRQQPIYEIRRPVFGFYFNESHFSFLHI